MRTLQVEDLYLDIYFPNTIEKAKSISVLYVLDGDAFAKIIAEVVKLQMGNSSKTGVSEVLIVGISYHEKEIFSRERRFKDYTPEKVNPTNRDDLRKNCPDGGKIKTFLAKVIEAHKLISKEYSINSKKIGFFGHSLGGLCVLESYLMAVLPFVTDYIAVSPSLWWDQEMFFERISSAKNIMKKNVHLSVGSLEGEMVSLAKRAKKELIAKNLVNKLNFYEAFDENHMSVVIQTISRNLRWFCT